MQGYTSDFSHDLSSSNTCAGYYARFAAFQQLIQSFLQRCSQSDTAGSAQIVSLGAGFDTTFFNLKVVQWALSHFILLVAAQC